MARTKPGTFLAGEAVTRVGAHDKRPSCLTCGGRIGNGEPTITIRGALVHMHCAVQRRRMARR